MRGRAPRASPRRSARPCPLRRRRCLQRRLVDADAVHALRRAAAAVAADGRLLVIEDAFHEEGELAGEHEAEEDLELLLLHGSGKRTRAEWLALFAEAGLRMEERSVGLGVPVFVLTPA